MTLQEFIAEKKRHIYEDLLAEREPRVGRYDEKLLSTLQNTGSPQMGTTIFEPEKVHLEFIFMSEGVSVGMLGVELDPPERIVFMPVPPWVAETVWQGEVDGSYHFETDAEELVRSYLEILKPLTNTKHFNKKRVIGRS